MRRLDKRNACVVASLLIHLGIFYSLQAAVKPEKPKLKNIELSIYKPAETPPPPEPEKKTPRPPRKAPVVVKDPVTAPPPAAAPPAAESPPVFGLSLSSTTNNANGLTMRVGNTTMTEPGAKLDPKNVLSGNGLGGRAPVSAAQVSKQATRIGECPPFDPSELYSKDARDAEIEGQVTLEVLVSEAGSVSEVQVVKSLGHGLDEAAVNAMRKHCKFQPAELGNEKVPTKIRYTFTFVLPD